MVDLLDSCSNPDSRSMVGSIFTVNSWPVAKSNCNIHVGVQCVCVVVQFYPWLKFYFPLFLGMVMYDKEFKTKENKV